MRLLYAAALSVSAALIFWAELLSARLLLPRLGGSAAVWNTALVFFQAALLAGYLYAHASTRWLSARSAPLLHPILLVAAAVVLPISTRWLGDPTGASPALWELGALALMLGAPFVILAGSSSLLQAWFTRGGGPGAADPYDLYAASNLGSLAALATYPTLIEPNLTLRLQSLAWAAGYAALVGLALACAVTAMRSAPPAAAAAPSPPPAWSRRLRWLALAFVPSSLLLGVTSHLTLNVAAAPLFWAVPLGLYLLSFILAFQRLLALPTTWLALAQAGLLAALAVTLLGGEIGPSLPVFALNLAAFFATALLCHQEAARLRPDAGRLTEFYLVLAAGGALGGAFNALIAPVLFNHVVEYPLMLVAAALLRPHPPPARRRGLEAAADIAIPAGLFAVLAALVVFGRFDLGRFGSPAQIFILLAGLIVVVLHRRPVRFALAMAALLLAAALPMGDARRELARTRNFYGLLRVVDRDDPPRRVLINGTIDHGSQSLDPARRLQPLSYYHPNGPLGQLFNRIGGGPDTEDVAVIGLGVGGFACDAHAGERWTYFEINPAVVRIATDPHLFTFLRDCPAHPAIAPGDARLSLQRAADHRFGLIVLDAFSSDAIPTHLLTREALELYLLKLKPGGLVVFHVSSQFLDLAPVVAADAASLGLSGKVFADYTATKAEPSATTGTDFKDGSIWAVVARTPQDLAAATGGDERWAPLEPTPGVKPWTDDYADIFDAFLRQQRALMQP